MINNFYNIKYRVRKHKYDNTDFLNYTNGLNKINAIKIQNRRNFFVNSWNHKCDNESDAVILSVHVRELCGWRDKCKRTFLDKVECKTIITILCTD